MLSNWIIHSKLMYQLFYCSLRLAAETGVFTDDFGDLIITDHNLYFY